MWGVGAENEGLQSQSRWKCVGLQVEPCCGAPVSPASVRRQGSESCLLWNGEEYPCASGSQRLSTGSSSGGGEPTRRPSECARRLAVVELDRVVTGMKMR